MCEKEKEKGFFAKMGQITVYVLLPLLIAELQIWLNNQKVTLIRGNFKATKTFT